MFNCLNQSNIYTIIARGWSECGCKYKTIFRDVKKNRSYYIGFYAVLGLGLIRGDSIELQITPWEDNVAFLFL